MKQLYVFSGLGADERAFPLFDFPGHVVTFIKWMQPLPGESLTSYAGRLALQIRQPEPVLIGLSFGGIVAQEVSRFIKAEKIILIASVKNPYELPFYFRLASFFSLHRLLPSSFLQAPGFAGYWLFGVQKPAEKKLLAQMLKDTDASFLRWAINAIVTWKGVPGVSKTIHLHGAADRIFPLRFVKPDYVITNGGHFMTVTKGSALKNLIIPLL